MGFVCRLNWFVRWSGSIIDMAKCPSDFVTPDLFNGRVSSPRVSMPESVRRRPLRSESSAVVAELCEWCGVDRAGGCGACSDLKYDAR